MIKVLLFAGLAEQAGTPVIELDEKETAASAVKTLLKERYGLQTIDMFPPAPQARQTIVL